jgi:cytochrome P450
VTRAETLSLHGHLLWWFERLSKKHSRERARIMLRMVLELPMARVCELLSVPERTAYRELREGFELLKRDIKDALCALGDAPRADFAASEALRALAERDAARAADALRL